jgi:hypothetical protein
VIPAEVPISDAGECQVRPRVHVRCDRELMRYARHEKHEQALGIAQRPESLGGVSAA